MSTLYKPTLKDQNYDFNAKSQDAIFKYTSQDIPHCNMSSKSWLHSIADVCLRVSGCNKVGFYCENPLFKESGAVLLFSLISLVKRFNSYIFKVNIQNIQMMVLKNDILEKTGNVTNNVDMFHTF